MKGDKQESFKINIGLEPRAKHSHVANKKSSEEDGRISSLKKWLWSVWLFCKEDYNRVTFSFKVGLAVLLVSLLILIQAPYEIFGANIIWSILTVAIMFEYTVGATFNRGFNRALGSLLAGILSITIMQFAMCTGVIAEPIVIGLSIFLVGAVTSFMKLWPTLVPYEYGFRVILFTFCLIVVSGYRMGNPIRTAMDRLYSIAIGAFVAVLVNVLVFPIWSGEQLHAELVKCFDSVADSLEECVKKYLDDDGSHRPEFSTTINDDFADEPAFRRCRSVLNSSSKLDSLAGSAKWEPPHGRFRHFFYPWPEYVKVGAVLRYCAYEVMALHGVLHSEIQAPYNLRLAFRTEILDATNQAAELVRSLGKDINNMKHSPQTTLLKRVHSSTNRLQRSIELHSYLLTCHDHKVTPPPSKLPSIKLTSARSFTPTELSTHFIELPITGNGGLEPTTSAESKEEGSGGFDQSKFAPTESCHESIRRQQRRLYSWPSREVDEFEEESGISMELILPRMKALESTAALSLATFTSLLIEFVARLDHLVDAVEELSKLAKFKSGAV